MEGIDSFERLTHGDQPGHVKGQGWANYPRNSPQPATPLTRSHRCLRNDPEIICFQHLGENLHRRRKVRIRKQIVPHQVCAQTEGCIAFKNDLRLGMARAEFG